MSWLSALLPTNWNSSQTPLSTPSSNSSNLAAMAIEISEQTTNTANRVNQLAPSERISCTSFDINFNGATQHLVIALTYNGHRASIERAKLQQLTEATKAVFELTYATLKQEKQARQFEITEKAADKKKVTKKEVKELEKLNHKLAILDNISSFSFIQKGNKPHLKVVSKDLNQEPLWIHLDSQIFEDINTLAQQHVENEVNRLEKLFTTDGLESEDKHKLDIMKYYLESRKLESRQYISLDPHPEIIRQADGRCFIQFKRENGTIAPIEIDSKLHPHVGAKHLQIDEFFNNFIQACNDIVEKDKDFAKKVGITNQQQQLSIEQQRQLAAAQQQQAMAQTQTAAANQQIAQQQAQAAR